MVDLVLVNTVAWAFGLLLRQRRAYGARLRTQAAEQAVTEERLRIARELHDMVAHSIGIIAIQAGAARRCIRTQPEGAQNSLSVIETTSRETLAGLRRMLGALRRADGTETADGAAPGLADLERLAEHAAGAGVRVELDWRGERSPLAPEVDLSAFRIVQEAVTNVVRHAGVDSCRVSIEHRPDAVAIEVLDDGHRPAHRPDSWLREAAFHEPGYGLIGMRERVVLLHGEFSAGPRPGGGFRVAARIPVPAAAR
jgi:signal transduction histidine kinase